MNKRRLFLIIIIIIIIAVITLVYKLNNKEDVNIQNSLNINIKGETNAN